MEILRPLKGGVFRSDLLSAKLLPRCYRNRANSGPLQPPSVHRSLWFSRDLDGWSWDEREFVNRRMEVRCLSPSSHGFVSNQLCFRCWSLRLSILHCPLPIPCHTFFSGIQLRWTQVDIPLHQGRGRMPQQRPHCVPWQSAGEGMPEVMSCGPVSSRAGYRRRKDRLSTDHCAARS